MGGGIIRRQFDDPFVTLDRIITLALGDQRIAKFAIGLWNFGKAGDDVAQYGLCLRKLVLSDENSAEQDANLVIIWLLFERIPTQVRSHLEFAAAKVGEGEIEHLLIMSAVVTDGGVLLTNIERW